MKPNAIQFHTRPMIGAAAGALLGVLCGTFFSMPWVSIVLGILGLVSGALLVHDRLGWGLLLLLFGILCIRTALVPKDVVQQGVYSIEGTVAEEPRKGSRNTTLTLRSVTLDGQPLAARLSIVVPNGSFRYGDTIRLRAETYPAGQLQQNAYRGIFTEAKAVGEAQVLSHRDDLYGKLLQLRRSFSVALDRLYADQADNAKGMLLGDRSGFRYEESKRYADNGILHIFAVSGMHMTVLLSLFGSLIRTRNRALNLALIALIAGCYCALTAFTPSVLRAAFFLLALQLPLIYDRQPDPPSAFCFSLAAVLLLNPYSLYSASFLLSFGAMAGILLLTKPLTNLLRLPDTRLCRTLIGSVSAVLGTLPLQAHLFGSFAWMAIPMSLLLMPALTVLMPLAFMSMLLSPFMPHVAKLLAAPPYGAFVYIDRITEWIAASPIALKQPHLLAVIAYETGLVFCSQLYLPNRNRVPWIGFGCMLTSLLLWIVL